MKLIQRGICLCRWGGGNGGEMGDDHCRDNGGDSDVSQCLYEFPGAA